MFLGTETGILKMVYSQLCHLHLGDFGLGSSNLWSSSGCRRTSYCGLVLVSGLMHGHVHRQFGSGAGLCVSYRRRNVLRYKARCSQ